MPDYENDDNVIVKDKQETKKAPPPKQYKVLLHNDNYTTMEFVIQVLETVFHKNVQDATKIMLDVHKRGVGVGGIYSKEVAETKSHKVMVLATQEEMPFKSTIEPE